jgi:SAM-dependent methyltransferase
VRLDDPAGVREQYATEERLEARRAFYRAAEGDDPREIAFAAVAEVDPWVVLEVGCGPGEAAERVARALGARVTAVDISPRMVELTHARGVDARVADVQELPFDDGSFDCVLAQWMLFHVPDLGRGLAEIVRVLGPGGRLVATTNAVDHLAELWELVGADPLRLAFSSENGEDLLARWFGRVERREARGRVVVATAEEIRAYVASSLRGPADTARIPELREPLVVTTHSTVFVAEQGSGPPT